MESDLKRLRGQKTQHDILHAALRLFAMHGYYHTSTHDILASLSLSKGAFYHHFTGKEALARQTLSFASEQITALLAASPSPEDKDPHAFQQLCRHLLTIHDTAQWDYLLLIARLGIEFAETNHTLLEAVTAEITLITQRFEQAIRQDQARRLINDTLVPQVAAELMTALLFGAAAIRSLSAGHDDFARLIGQLEDLFYSRPRNSTSTDR